jgi:hypothetical protein
MNQRLSKIAILSLIVLAVSFSASAQVYVKIRPVPPVIVRTAPPSPEHVWIDEEWEPREGKYVYVGGHWIAPPHRGYVWVPGHWNHHERHGEIWVRGHWKRK